MNRRTFLRNSTFSVAGFYLNTLPVSALSSNEILQLTILHTNDVHSRIEPFPEDGGRNAGQGGVAKRASLIKQIRKDSPHTLLLDAGDIFQGTPYFNQFGGELEIELMSQMGYDAATMGNHDFDAGIDGFLKQLHRADFPFITSNYGFKDTPLYGRTVTNKVFDFGDIRVGLYGLGIELRGLVASELYLDTVYFDPVETAVRYEQFLKYEMKCDYVICLSHLGFRYSSDKVSDIKLAQNTGETDLIIGGHTHTFMQEPHIEKNLKGQPVIINQVGFAGIMLGRLDIYFEQKRKRRFIKSHNAVVN